MINSLRKGLLLVLSFLAVIAVFPTANVFAEEDTPDTTTTTTTTTTTSTTTTTTTNTTTTTTTTTPSSTTKTSKTTTSKTTTVKKKLSFKDDNKKEVAVSKSIVLYITSSGISSLQTEFSSSDTGVASVLKINDSSVRVFGLADGTATISATSNEITATWKIKVGTGPSTTTTTTTPDMGGTTITTPNNILEIAPNQTTTPYTSAQNTENQVSDEELYGLNNIKKSSNMLTLIAGITWWGIMIVGIVFVTLLILRNNAGTIKIRSSTLSNYKSSFGRSYSFSSSRYSSNRSKKRRRSGSTRTKRLLPDHYYRSLRKW